MKSFAVALGVAVALVIGASAQAETISYSVSGWQSTCSATWHTGTSTTCTFSGSSLGRLSGGTITGSAQFVGDSVSGGTLTVSSNIYVTSSTPGVGPVTVADLGGFYLAQYGDPEGLTVTGTFLTDCTPPSDPFCTTPNTPISPTHIDIYGPGNTPGGTVQYLVKALSSGSTNMVWQGYTLTVVPEPGTALLLGAGLLALAVSGRRRK